MSTLLNELNAIPTKEFTSSGFYEPKEARKLIESDIQNFKNDNPDFTEKDIKDFKDTIFYEGFDPYDDQNEQPTDIIYGILEEPYMTFKKIDPSKVSFRDFLKNHHKKEAMKIQMLLRKE